MAEAVKGAEQSSIIIHCKDEREERGVSECMTGG